MSTFLDQLAVSGPGDEIVYHEGFHCMKERAGRDPVKINAAKDAWSAYLRGDVILYQRRVGFDHLKYCAKVLR